MKNFLFLWIALLFSMGSLSGEISPNIKIIDQPNTVLFVGNSYLYYNNSLHNHFKRMVEEHIQGFNGGDSVKSSTIGGSRLKHHDVSRLISPQAISKIEKFDLVILQGGSSETLSKKNRKEFAYYAKRHIDSVKENDSEAALYMTHAYADHYPRYEPNQIEIIRKAYTKVGNENGVLVIPVGLAFDMAYQKRPNIKLHDEDGTHPGPLGTYLAACTVFASVYDLSPIGMEYDYFGSINELDKLFLQEIAHEATSTYFNKTLK
ncbi:MAG TPA: hypothetical protein QF857_03415 [Gammaproteobacteria bacterium]|nr:hypothetical protein [Gammaproteobacteria bacterium]